MKTKMMIVLLLAFTQMSAQWTQQNSGTTNNLIGIHGIGSTLYFTGTSISSKTTNGGTTWNSISSTSGTFVKMYDLNTIFIGQTTGGIYRTSDGGANWIQDPVSGSSPHRLYDINFKDNLIFLAAGGNPIAPHQTGGSVFKKTIDACQTWQAGGIQPSAPTYFGLSRSSIYSIAVGGGQSIKKSDWGDTWTTVLTTNPNPIMFYDVDFPNSGSVGYVVGGTGRMSTPTTTGVMYKTIDAGLTWTSISSLPTSVSLYGVCFTSVDTGYVVGASGSIFKTIDGGVSWTTQSSGVTTGLNSIYFTSKNVGYIVGNNGVVLKTTNGGENATSVSEISQSDYFILNGDGKITIQSNYPIGNFILYNTVGQEIMNEKISDNSFTIATSNFKNGIYFCQVGNRVKKILIK